MITNQKIKKSLDEIKQITSLDVILYSAKNKFVASTIADVEKLEDKVTIFIESEEEASIIGGYSFFRVEIEDELEYVLITFSSEESNLVLGRMAACQIKTLVRGESERYDKSNFVQNILLGNVLNADIMIRSKKLHLENKPRVIFVIDTGKHTNEMALELVKNLSNIRSGDIVVSMEENNVVLVKDVSGVKEEDLEDYLNEVAKSLVDNLQMEAMIKVRVGYGNKIDLLIKLAESYQEAKLALEVGRVFYVEREIISYANLGIGRLIYQLPMSLCEMFIKEVFGDEVPDILDDEEAMSTINKFFENNLNISETARQLYVHRNTLVYRLERIEKAIGLDIRSFDDAMTFRIAVMVLAHIRDNKKLL